MSRLAKKPVPLPAQIQVSFTSETFTVTGPLGAQTRALPRSVSLTKEEGGIRVSGTDEAPETKMLLGTTVAHLKNMIAGSQTPFSKKLIIEGIGFKAEVKPARPDDPGRSSGGTEVVMALGFSHPVKLAIPAGLKVTAEKGALTISGSEREAVGQFAARVRAQKKPEPYKGKGIRYETEVIRRKQGKKTV